MSQYTTYSRAILSDFKKIVELLQKHSHIAIEHDPRVPALPILPARLLDDALADPHNRFLQFIIQSFGAYAKAHKELYEQRQQLDELQAKITQLQAQVQSTSMENAEQTLAHHQHALENVSASINSNQERLTNNLTKLAEIAEKQDKAWDAFRAENIDTLLKRFDEIQFDLNQNEIDMLRIADNWAVLLQRRQSLNIPIPKSIKLDEPYHSSYFQLKCFMAIHSSLSRRMLPNSVSEVQKIYDKL